MQFKERDIPKKGRGKYNTTHLTYTGSMGGGSSNAGANMALENLEYQHKKDVEEINTRIDAEVEVLQTQIDDLPNKFLSKESDDVAEGTITFNKGLIAKTPLNVLQLKQATSSAITEADGSSITETGIVTEGAVATGLVELSNATGDCNFLFEILPQDRYDSLAQKSRKVFYFIADESEKVIPKVYIGDLLFTIGGGNNEDILIDSILLSSYQLTLDDAQERIIATFLPDNATSKTLKWLSSDINVAMVNSSGVVTPMGNGDCIIKVEAVRGGATAEASVRVSISVKSVKIMNTETELNSDEPLQLIAQVLPTNAKNKTLHYESSNVDIATVTPLGMVTYKKDGEVIITATSDNHISDSISLTALTPVRSLAITNKITSLDVGETHQFQYALTPSNATNRTVLWDSSNTDVATIENGLVKAIKKGDVTIQLSSLQGGKKDDNVIRIIIPATNLTIQGAAKIVAGYDYQLSYIPTPVDADVYTLRWSVSEPTMATVSDTGMVRSLVQSGIFNVILQEPKHNLTTSMGVTVVPFAVEVSCTNIDKTDNSVSSIFSKWQLTKKGAPTHYKYTETIKENGTESTLQSVDWTPIPADGVVDIELYAEFGYKYINWQFKNEDNSYQEDIVAPIFYKEPELITYNFDVNVQCTQEEAETMSMEIPYYKYDKKFTYCLRNDDNLTSLWRMAFRYCNREYLPKKIKRYERTDGEMNLLSMADKRRSPRRLGYTDGCDTLIPFVFDTAGVVETELGLSFESGNATEVQREDILKHKDYGGHFILHNMNFLTSDPIKQKYENDYTYPLQRDRNVLHSKFGYTSVTYANPDGDPYYTQPCIKDPKTLLMSGGGAAFYTPESLANNEKGTTYGERFPASVSHYGLPAHRTAFSWDSNLSNVPLSEIRNTLNTSYVYSENHPFRSNLWRTQHQLASLGKPTLATELTHGLGYNIEPNGSISDENTALLRKDLSFFEEIFDIAGANGSDTIWFCSADEAIEYMYYQRVAKISKLITSTGCKFIINITIPDYLSYKTYSAIIRNLPETAIVTRGKGVTSFSKNMKTGLINFGYSTDTTERASRYVQKYLENPTNDNLDNAWYFTRLLGELQTPYSSQLPVFNEVPVISSVSCPETVTVAKLSLTTVNANKEFGEANFLDVSDSETFSNVQSYSIPSGTHKWYDSLDDSCLSNTFEVDIKPLFEVVQNVFVRLRNVYGYSNTEKVSVKVIRVDGVNDPLIELTPNAQFKYDDHIECAIYYENINEFRYKVDEGEFTVWSRMADSVDIPLAKGIHIITIQGRNNLNEVVEKVVNVNFTGKHRVVLFGNVTTAGIVDSVGYVNKVSNAEAGVPQILDLEGVQIGKEVGKYYKYNKTIIDKFRAKYGISLEVNITPAYWESPTFIDENGLYPNNLIVNSGKKEIQLYGGIRTDSTQQAVKYLTEMPAGNYKVKLLLSAKTHTAYKYPNIIRVQNQLIQIPAVDSSKVINNNQYWYEFNDVIVDEDGFLLISQYSDVTFAGALDRLSPIVLMEITKI